MNERGTPVALAHCRLHAVLQLFRARIASRALHSTPTFVSGPVRIVLLQTLTCFAARFAKPHGPSGTAQAACALNWTLEQ